MVKRIRRHEAVNKMADYSASNAAAKKKSTTLQDEGNSIDRKKYMYQTLGPEDYKFTFSVVMATGTCIFALD